MISSAGILTLTRITCWFGLFFQGARANGQGSRDHPDRFVGSDPSSANFLSPRSCMNLPLFRSSFISAVGASFPIQPGCTRSLTLYASDLVFENRRCQPSGSGFGDARSQPGCLSAFSVRSGGALTRSLSFAFTCVGRGENSFGKDSLAVSRALLQATASRNWGNLLLTFFSAHPPQRSLST